MIGPLGQKSRIGDRLPVTIFLLTALSLGAPARASADRDAAQAHIDAGVTLIEEGKDQEAEREFRAAIDADRNMVKAHYNRGVVLHRLNRNQDAETELRITVELQPDHAKARYYLGKVLAVSGRADAARVEFESALKSDPALGAARDALRGLSSGGDPSGLDHGAETDDALNAVKSSIEEALKSRDHATALLHLTHLSQHHSEFLLSRYLGLKLVRELTHAKRTTEAREWLDRAAMKANKTDVQRAREDIDVAEGRFDSAITSISSRLSKMESNVKSLRTAATREKIIWVAETCEKLAQVQEAAGDQQGAEESRARAEQHRKHASRAITMSELADVLSGAPPKSGQREVDANEEAPRHSPSAEGIVTDLAERKRLFEKYSEFEETKSDIERQLGVNSEATPEAVWEKGASTFRGSRVIWTGRIHNFDGGNSCFVELDPEHVFHLDNMPPHVVSNIAEMIREFKRNFASDASLSAAVGNPKMGADLARSTAANIENTRMMTVMGTIKGSIKMKTGEGDLINVPSIRYEISK